MPHVGVAISLDFFPARVTLPSGVELGPCRLFIADGRVQVFILRNGQPELYFDEPLVAQAKGSTATGYDLAVESGEVRVVNDGGCGCGNPLRRFNPWPGVPRQLVRL